MQVRISWDPSDCGDVKAKDVLADARFKVTQYVGSGLEAQHNPATFHTALQFGVEDYGEAGKTVEEIQWFLWRNWKIFSRVSVSTTMGAPFEPLSGYVSHLEWKASRRENAMKDAIALLSDTANWLKDRRIAAIRHVLEQNL